MRCTLHGMEGKRLVAEAAEPIAVSAPIGIECNDVLILGEVLTCRTDLNGFWMLDIKVHQILTGLASLMALRAHLLCSGADSLCCLPRHCTSVHQPIRYAAEGCSGKWQFSAEPGNSE